MQNASDILSQVICTTALVLCGDCCPHLQMSRLRHRVRGPASPPSCCLQPLRVYASRLPIPPSLSGDPQNMEWVLSEDVISISLGDCIQPEKTSLVLICSHSSPQGRENLQLFFSDSNSPPIPTPTPRHRPKVQVTAGLLPQEKLWPHFLVFQMERWGRRGREAQRRFTQTAVSCVPRGSGR